MPVWLIEKGAVRIAVKTKAKHKEATALIELALSALKPERIKRPERLKKFQVVKISVEHRDDEWSIKDHVDGVSRKLNQPGDLIYHLTDRIVFHIADKAENVHCLHAAAVAKNGCAVLVPANSGAGKSTFVTWLAHSGFDYLTDELILLDADRQVEGVARPIQIKSNGFNAIQELLVKPELLQPGKFTYALPLESIGAKTSEQQKHRLSLIIFPQYKKGEAYSLTKLSSAEAGMSLMANHVNARNLAGHGFQEMMAIIRSTLCYSLVYGGFDTLPSDFSSQLETLLKQ